MPGYVFKLGPETGWLIGTAVMTYMMTLTVTDFTDVMDWRKFAVSVGVGLMRAIFGALLSAGGGGVRPGTPQVPTIDEKIGVSPRAVATPKLPDDQG